MVGSMIRAKAARQVGDLKPGRFTATSEGGVEGGTWTGEGRGELQRKTDVTD
jgi:hypothetical protein